MHETDSATIAGALKAMAQAFRSAGIEGPERDAALLLAAATGHDRLRQLTDPDAPVTADAQERVAMLVARRLAREPVSRILGARAFYGRDFVVTSAVLDPRPDSETLIDTVLSMTGHTPMRILDIGTGSGCLLLTLLAERPRWSGIGLDICPAALAVAADNAALLGLTDRLHLIEGDLAADLATLPDCNIVISNPPYIPAGAIDALEPEVRLYDPWLALDGGSDGLAPYRAIAATAPVLPGGLLALEIGSGAGAAVAAMLTAAGWSDVAQHNDLAGTARVITVRKPAVPVTKL